MNISELTSDAKYLLAQKLSGKDLVRLCATDKSMRQICSSSKYNPIWIKLLKNDYNVNYNGTNAYMEYLHNTYFLNKSYYVVSFTPDDETTLPIDPILCKTRDEGLNRIKEYVDQHIKNGNAEEYETLSYIEIEIEMKIQNHVLFHDVRIYLEEANFKSNAFRDYKEEYQSDLDSIAEIIYPDNKNKQEKFKVDFNTILEEQVEEDEFNLNIILSRIKNELIPDGNDENDVIMNDIEKLLKR